MTGCLSTDGGQTAAKPLPCTMSAPDGQFVLNLITCRSAPLASFTGICAPLCCFFFVVVSYTSAKYCAPILNTTRILDMSHFQSPKLLFTIECHKDIKSLRTLLPYVDVLYIGSFEWDIYCYNLLLCI